MAITVNTNISSMIVQRNLAKSTTSLNNAIERMTTGYKINHAADNAAGYSIARNWEAQISSLDVAADNAATGADMLSTLEDNYALISSHVQRVRDLTEQAANGTYGDQSKKAIESEIQARLDEIDRIAANCEFNGIKLMAGKVTTGDAGDVGLDIQVGIDGTASKSRIHLDKSLFANGKVAGLFTNSENLAKKCSGQVTGSGNTAQEQLAAIDTVISTISERITTLGAAQNRIESAIESIGGQS